VIHGVVNANLEATIPLHVVSPNGLRQEITAIIDTGYNGALSLPHATVIALALMPSAPRMVTLGDASQRVLDFYTANLHWGGQVRRIRSLCVEGSPLVGTVLLQGYKLEVDFTPGGAVALTPLPSYPPSSSPYI
jgi:clan AA aspartic protease